MAHDYEPYHLHSMYSNALMPQVDSMAKIEQYAEVIHERNQKVLCITEHGNRSNVWLQFEQGQKYGLLPLAGAEAYFVPNRDPELKDNRNFHLILIAKNMEGFYQLNTILSAANMTGYYRRARVDFDLLSQLDYRNFICTTACVAGPVSDPEGEQYCQRLHSIFRENFYLEVQPHPQRIQVEHNKRIMDLYSKYGWPLIFATDSHYVKPEEKEDRKELLLSASGLSYGDEDEFLLDLPDPDEAYKRMVTQGVLSRARIEEAMENTLILREFDGVSFDHERKFPISRPDLTQEERNTLYKRMVCSGYIDKAGMPSEEEAKEIHKELDTIVDTNSADYFIGLHDMIKKGQENGGILTTTSRGSCCGFVSNYALGFTTINRFKSPVKMYPDRFISKAKLASGSMPDIDSNLSNVEAFEKAGKEIFGEHGCYPMIAYGTNKTSSAFKMLARARDLDFQVSNAISKQIATYELDVKHAKENNEDDPDYDVNDDVQISDYVEEQYLQLIEDSKQYQGIIVSVTPHPCAHLVYHKDLRREIGVIRLKDKAGSNVPQYCVYVDGKTADEYGYVKSDLLRVSVVKFINDTFKAIGRPVPTSDELIQYVTDNEDVWKIYENGYTFGVNQVEQEKTQEKVKRFKPRNTVELSAFIAAIRPGAKSLVNDFVNRKLHTYGIPAMDKLLRLNGATGVTGQSSFLLYDENVMTLAESAGVDPADAQALIKAIKKKKHDKVAAYKEQFIPGFRKYLIEKEHADQKLAEKTANDVWTVIMNSASYLFNASHAYAMCLDSLYGAYLKVIAPYEFYTVLLKHYTEKKNSEKIAKAISEMKAYMGINVVNGKFGQDNRDWFIDKEHKTISQSLPSIKFLNRQNAIDLYEIKDRTTFFSDSDRQLLNEYNQAIAEKNEKIREYNEKAEQGKRKKKLKEELQGIEVNEVNFTYFTDFLRFAQMQTSLGTRELKILIELDYFSPFGRSGKLMKVYNAFFEGEGELKPLAKGLKNIENILLRLEALRQYEKNLIDEDLWIVDRLTAENDNIGLCLSKDDEVPSNVYFIQTVDNKYGGKLDLYSIQRGTAGRMRIRKNLIESMNLEKNGCIVIDKWASRPKYSYTNGKRTPSGENEFWIERCHFPTSKAS